MSKLMIRIIPFLALLLLVTTKANAQGGSVYFGVGSAWDRAGTTTTVCPSGELYDGFTAECEPGPTLGGAFGVLGADFMFTPHLGFNGEYSFRFAQAPYLPDAGLYMRPKFYDFNAVWEPISGSENRIVPVLEAGVGGTRVTLYESQTNCVTGACGTTTYPAGLSANHFQVHAAAGVKVYVSGNIFIKPQFDLRYVNNLTQQFGRDWVPQLSVSIGYTFGQR